MTRRVEVAIVGDARSLERAFGRASKAGSSLGRALKTGALVVGAAVTGLGVASVKSFAAFDDKLQKSVAIMGDVSESMRGEISDAAREVGKTTKFSAKDAAESFFFLASAGLDAKASIAALPQVAAFAQAGNFDMAQATDLLTDAQSALGLSSKEAGKNLKNMAQVSDVLVKANTLANASVEQFSEALTNKAGAALKVLGKDTIEGVAVLAAFADQGLKGSAAGEALNIVLRDLQTSSLKNTKGFKELGISVFDNKGEMRDVGKIIGQLEGALDGMSDEQKRATLTQLGFQDRSISNIQTLLGSSKAIGRYEKQLKKAGGTTKDVADKQLKSFSGQLALLKGKVADVGLELGSRLVPILLRLVDWVQTNWPQIEAVFASVFAGMKTAWETILRPALEQAREGFQFVVDWVRANWDEISDVAEDVFGAIAGIVRNQLLPTLRTMVDIGRTVVKGFRDHREIALPLTAAIGGMAAAVGLWNIATKIAAVSTAAWAAIQAVLNVVLTANPIGLIIIAIAGLVAGLVTAWKTSETFRNVVGAAWEAVKDVSLRVWAKIKKIVVDVIAKLKEAWQRFGPTIIALAKNAFTTIKRVIKAAMQVVQGVIDVVMGVISGDWGRAWDGIKGIVGGVINGIKAIISGQLGQLKILMQSLGKKMLQGITSGLKALGAKIQSGLIDPIADAITGFFGGAFAKANELAAKIIGGIKSGLSRVAAAMADFAGRVLGAIADAAGRMFSAALSIGSAIIDGVIAGMGDIAGKVGGKLKSGLDGGVNFVKSGFGIFSPSKKMADEVGKPLAEGVIAGLLKGLGPLPEKFSDELKAAIERGRAVVDRARSSLANSFGRVGSDLLRAFDAQTSATETASQTELRLIGERRQSEDQARAVADAEASLADARKGGDLVAIADAERGLARAREDITITTLQRQADAERLSFESRRELQRAHLEEKLANLEAHLAKEGAAVKKSTKEIRAVMDSFGISFSKAGLNLGAGFVAGLRTAIGAAAKNARGVGKGIRGQKKRIRKLPGLADGGTVTSGGRALVGERGPELLDLDRGARVIPLDAAGRPMHIENLNVITSAVDPSPREIAAAISWELRLRVAGA